MTQEQFETILATLTLLIDRGECEECDKLLDTAQRLRKYGLVTTGQYTAMIHHSDTVPGDGQREKPPKAALDRTAAWLADVSRQVSGWDRIIVPQAHDIFAKQWGLERAYLTKYYTPPTPDLQQER